MTNTVNVDKMPKAVKEALGTAQKALTLWEHEARKAYNKIRGEITRRATETIGLATKADLKAITGKINKLSAQLHDLMMKGVGKAMKVQEKVVPNQ